MCLDDAAHERFARRLGELVPHPTIGARDGTASILELDASRGGGRADHVTQAQPRNDEHLDKIAL